MWCTSASLALMSALAVTTVATGTFLRFSRIASSCIPQTTTERDKG